MSDSPVLLATAKIRFGQEAAFSAWQTRHNSTIAQFPGFQSSDVIPGGAAGSNEWTIIVNFQTPDQLRIWHASSERARLVAESDSFLDGGDLRRTKAAPKSATNTESAAAEVILSKVKPGMDDAYREWSVRIQNAMAQDPGYRGLYLQPPTTSEGRRDQRACHGHAGCGDCRCQ